MDKDATSTSAPEVEPAYVAPPSETDRLVEAWFVETFHGIQDLPVEHFNRFRAAADRLKARLSAAKE